MPTESDWIQLSRALDPWRELPLDDSADALFVEVPYSPSVAVVRRLRAWHRGTRGGGSKEAAPKFLYCGARGGGKTTQLRRLVRELTGECEVLFLDLATVLPDQVSTLHLLTHIGLALIARLGQWEGADGGVSRVLTGPDGKGFASVLGRLVEGADLEAVVSAIAPLVSAAVPAVAGPVTSATTVIKAIRDVLPGAKELDPLQRLSRTEKFLRRLAGNELEEARVLALEVSRLADALHGRAAKPVVMLADGLDKVLTLDGVLGAFDDIDLLRRVSCPVVLTAPASLSSDVRFIGLRPDIIPLDLQNIPVVNADGTERIEHVDRMVAIATKRMTPALRAMVTDEALHDAAVWSSGLPRDFLSFLNDAALVAEEESAPSVTRLHVRQITKEFRLRMQKPLTEQDLGLLNRVLQTRRLPENDRAQLLLFQNIIAWYPNEHGYFRPHELLADWVAGESARLAGLNLDPPRA